MAGHIIAVVGGKGGVGKSVFAANFAIAYLKNFRQRPLIVDLDLASLGDLNLILGVNPPKTIVDASRMPPGKIDPKSLAPFMLNSPQGYSFIGAPRDAISAREIDLDGLGRLLKGLTQVFALTVVDCGQGTDPAALKVMENASAIFVVTAPDVIVINQTKRLLAKIQELLFPPEMVQVVLNRHSQGSIVSPQMMQSNLNRPLFAAIPEDSRSCDGSLAKGVPVYLAAPNAPIARAYNDVVRKVFQNRLLEKLETLKKPTGIAQSAQNNLQVIPGGGGGDSGKKDPLGRSRSAKLDPWTAMKIRLHKALVEKMDLKKADIDTSDERQKGVLREKTQKAVLELLNEEDTAGLLTTRELKSQMVKEILDEALGLGPLEDLLSDPSVTEIMVNARDQIYIERSGKIQLSKVNFTSELQMMNVIERIVTPLGRRVDEKVPYVDARLEDGSRVHIIIHHQRQPRGRAGAL